MRTTFLIINLFFVLATQAQEKKEAIRGTPNYLRVEKNGKWGVVNKAGKKITAIKYDYVNSFSGGVICVALNRKYGVIDTMGRELTPIKYDAFFDFYDGFAAVQVDKKYGYINTDGKEITPMKYGSFYSFSDGCCPVTLNGKCGFINGKGEVIIPIQYDMADIYSIGIPVVFLNKKKIYFTANGKELPSLSKYEEMGPFSNGLAFVKLDHKYGYVNKEGEEVIAVQFDSCSNFEETGVAHVWNNGISFYIDKQGKVVKE
ncbi:WG containing repeat-containing protein [Chitinophaga sp. YR627]|uniref:WG repeat-containing protein n=1 Tax=Chitinophaga sp. YR627 TaxID=1881041 RepID=UPI0008E8315D|nr:WG repeat-containing protein [Chitinophaga sp. YR627]SFO99301.1 WG containing repeat-containing protein [Chitinophaga sp. YR627]